MTKIENVEAAEKWAESVDRVLACAGAVKANVKAFEAGGASANDALEAVERSRAALKSAMGEEQARWKKMLEPPAQQKMDMDGEERSGPKALPPRRVN